MPLLSYYAVKLLRGETLEILCPMLVWRGAPVQPGGKVWRTLASEKTPRPTQVDPVVLEVKKADRAGNAFSMGITLGRVESNDICIEHDSVSRFHAYFQQTRGRGGMEWKVVDAESMNGTFMGPNRLTPNLPQKIKDGSHLRFGDVEVEFYEPRGFQRYLETLRALEGK